MGMLGLWVFFTISGLSLKAQVLDSQNLACNSDDFRALERFMNGFESAIEGWNFNSTISSSSNCCNWVGITCNSSISLGLNDPVNSGRVVKLELPSRRLQGMISDSFILLNQLRTLNLSNNLIDGSLPFSLFHLPKLEILDLRNNEFISFIQPTINLPSIRSLDLSDSYFYGSVPLTTICQNSTQIKSLNLGVNNFNGFIPPEIGNCTSLEHLSLDGNYLTGVLPNELFRLHKLTRFSLQDNDYTGSLTSNIGNLSNLVSLDVSLNRFSGNIPDFFCKLRKLEFFDADTNNFTGLIPKSLSSSPSISYLNLRNNSLYGPIALNCSAMVNLTFLNLEANQFVGSFPDNLPSCLRLKTLSIGQNKISGQIPESYKNFHSLTFLSVSNCSIINITSALGILQHCKNLTTLILPMNFRNEEIFTNPSLHFKSLKALVIAGCGLIGVFPQWVASSTQLQLLDLSSNHLEGLIPTSLGNLSSLFYLDLSYNSFTGNMPQSLAALRSLAALSSLASHTVPLNEKQFINYQLFWKNNLARGGLLYKQIWSLPPTLDLSNNLLTGPIWPEFGNLKAVLVLNLNYNNLSGNIPGSLSGMTNLVTLDLSHNNLSGTIPQSLVALSLMSMFSVAFNNLSGKIPHGGQFQTFPSSSYEGNQDLWGYQTAPRGPRIIIQSPTESTRKSSKSKATNIVFVLAAAGFGAGMTIGIRAGTVAFDWYKRRNQTPLR